MSGLEGRDKISRAERTPLEEEVFFTLQKVLEEGTKTLSPRDLEVWKLSVQHQTWSNQKIAASLELRPETVNVALNHIKEKIGRYLTEGITLVIVRSAADDAVKSVYAKARVLCKKLGATPLMFPALVGLCRYYLFRGEYRRSCAFSEKLKDAAKGAEGLPWAHLTYAAASFFLGNPAQACDRAEEGLGAYQSQRDVSWAPFYGGDSKVGNLCYLAVSLWWRGYPEQALARIDEALASAEDLNAKKNEPLGLVLALNWAASIYQECGKMRESQRLAEKAVRFSKRQKASFYEAWGFIQQGWAMVKGNHGSKGVERIECGLKLIPKGACLGQTYFFALLSKAYQSRGGFEKGVDALDKAIAFVQSTEEHFYEAELYRIKGEILLAHDAKTQEVEAERLFNNALRVSRQQQAKSLELRATISMARLWQRQGKYEKAWRSLAEVYGHFTEGFKTKDLQEARALLAVLGEKGDVARLTTKEKKIVVVILLEDNKGKFLVHWRLDNRSTNPGCLAIGAGGACDQDESIEEAAKRKLREETGITSADLTFLGTLPATYGDKQWTDYIFYTPVPSERVVNPPEPKRWKKWKWMTAEEIEARKDQLCSDTAKFFTYFQEARRNPFLP